METAPSWYRHFCAGVLISPMAVLTTAHCIKFFRSDLNSDFGTLNVPIYASFAPQCRHMQGQHHRVLINSYRVHQKYRKDRVAYDIAVLKLEVAADESIQAVDFRTSKSFRRIDQYKKLHVVGWGSISIQDHSKTRFNRRVEPLHYATLEAYDYNSCQKDLMKSGAIGVTLDEKTMMCAYSIQADTCEGDSGGPLLVSDLLGDAQYDILVGLTSFGPDVVCGGSLYLPGVYTKISSFVKWIEDSLKELKATDSDADSQKSSSSSQDGPLPFVKFDPNQPQINDNPSPNNISVSPSPKSLDRLNQKHHVEDVVFSEVDPADLDQDVVSNQNFEDRQQAYVQECMTMARIMGTALSDCV